MLPTWIAATALAAAVGLWLPPRVRLRVPTVRAATIAPGGLERYRLVWSVLGGGGLATLVGGFAGVLVGTAAALTVWVLVGRSEPRQVRERRERIQRDLPAVVDLLASVLSAGAAPASALELVGRSFPGPAGETFTAVARRLELGVDPSTVWTDVSAEESLGLLGRSLSRALDSGASVAAAVRRLADDLAEESRTEAESRARAVGVRVAAPLGLCLLPAFVLVGVVPMVVGLLSTLRLG